MTLAMRRRATFSHRGLGDFAQLLLGPSLFPCVGETERVALVKNRRFSLESMSTSMSTSLCSPLRESAATLSPQGLPATGISLELRVDNDSARRCRRPLDTQHRWSITRSSAPNWPTPIQPPHLQTSLDWNAGDQVALQQRLVIEKPVERRLHCKGPWDLDVLTH